MNVKIASVRVKPKLQEHHKMARIKFILDQIDWTVKSHPVYRSQEKLVHIDEKMFRYLRQVTRLKVFPTSPRFPNSTALSKSHDDQVMFIAAVSEPSSTFDGKIGMLAFLDEVAAERSSKNRPRGARILKPYTVDAAAFLDVMVREDGILDFA
jgi:hypothetical protein